MSSLERLPAYLRKYVVEQDYHAYTSQEHATWRYIMRQSRKYFADHAVDIYLPGLKQTGISIDKIPRLTDMDRCMNELGWGAVGVEGFIPASVFLDLLARGILPIATDMRTLEHVGYTPAPDIVHEAAGHAPIIADPAYRNFLKRYSQIAYRSLISADDIAYYEAVRYLSDIKENPDTKPGEVERASERLKTVSSSIKDLSESGKVARFAWWTVEYGLVGDLKKQKIYGAGLLSSVSESRDCLSPKVKKIPLSLHCVDVSYDITEPQPQLFVADSLDALPDVLSDFENTLAFKRGGIYGLSEALKARTLNSVEFEQQLSVSGILNAFEASDDGTVHFLKFSGPSQLCYQEKELTDQGRTFHPEGFSSPIGRWQGLAEVSPSHITTPQMERLGLKTGERATLKFVSGFTVEGILKRSLREDGRLLLLSWQDCTVRRGSTIYYQPSWGNFDMLVGETVTSVYAGPADRMSYGDFDVGEASTSPGRTSPFSSEERDVFKTFDELRVLRATPASALLEEKLADLAERILQNHKSHWLLGLEVAEIAKQKLLTTPRETVWLQRIHDDVLNKTARSDPQLKINIERGLDIVSVAD